MKRSAARRHASRKVAVLATVLLATTTLGISTPAHADAVTSPYDITAAITKLGTPTSRDFGIDRLFTRITFTSTAAQTVTFERYDWASGSWAPFFATDGPVAGTQVATFAPVTASKIRTPQSGVTITGVYDDSPLTGSVALDITTTVGVPPVLPEEVNVDQENGGRVLVPVTWDDPYPDSQWDSPGTTTITGSYGSGDDTGPVTTTVTVTAERGLPQLTAPYMGWNTWYTMSRAITEDGVRSAVAALEAKGLPQAGYDIIWLDEGWWQSVDPIGPPARTNPEPYRDGDGDIVVSDRFSDDIGVLADWLHARGLKIGLYADPDQVGCGDAYGNGGQNWFEFFRKDIAKYVQWGIDAIKMDHCGSSSPSTRNFASTTNFALYSSFYQALRAADPNGTIVYDISEWGDESSGDWAYKIANGWRTGADLSAPSLDAKYYAYWERNLNRAASQPGAYNDPDYLVVTNTSPSLDPETFRVQYSMWAMAASPLILSANPSLLTPAHVDILTNKEMLAIDQDPLAIQPVKIREDVSGAQVWARPLADEDGRKRAAVMLLNTGGSAASIGFDWSEIGLANVSSVRDVWQGVDESPATGYTGVVFPNEVTILVAEGDATAITSGYPTYDYARLGFTTASSSAKSGYDNASAFRSQGAVDGFTPATCPTTFASNPTPSCWWQPHSLEASQPAWLEVDFRQQRTVDEAVLTLHQAYAGTARVQYLSGGAWVDAATAGSLASGATTVDFAPVTTTAMRLLTADGNGLQVSEFEIYGPDEVDTGYTSLAHTLAPAEPANYALASTGNTTAAASSSYPCPTYCAANLIDGITSADSPTPEASTAPYGRWSSQAGTAPQWATVTWTTPETRGATLSLDFGGWYHRMAHGEVYYCPPENAPCNGADTAPWVELADLDSTAQGSEVATAPVVDLPVGGLAIKAVKVVWTAVQNWTGHGTNPQPSMFEIRLLGTRDPVLSRTVNVTTRAGRPPALPATADARYDDGSWGTRDVTWDAVDPAAYAEAGSFTATGVVTGTAVPATARVTVLARPSTPAELQSLVDANADRAEADYTTGSWAPFARSLAAARALLARDPAPTAAEIRAAGAALEDTVDALASIADLAPLVEQVAGLQQSDYVAGWDAFAAALAAAQQVLADPDATQATIDAACHALDAAADGLRVENLALAPRATATASSVWRAPDYAADKVNDGDVTTRWNSGAAETDGAWVRLDWSEAQAANDVRLVFDEWWARVGLAHVQYQDADGGWVTLASIAIDPQDGQYPAGETVDIPIGNREISNLRVVFEKTVNPGNGANPTFWELEVYDWPVVGVAPVEVATTAATPAALPATVTTALANRTTAQAQVTWDAIPAERWLQPGTFTVHGAIPGTDRAATATVTVRPLTPTTAPSVTGTPEVMGLLTADPGRWGVDGLRFGYQWNADGRPVDRATSAALSVTAALSGKPVSVTVTATKDGYPIGSATSAPVTVTAVPPWNARTVYDTGDQVLYGDRLYQAQWWTQNQVPSSSPWLAWSEVGATVPCSADVTVRQWTDSAIYTGGETVVHDGRLWHARWWTRNQVPGDANGPWQQVGSCGAA